MGLSNEYPQSMFLSINKKNRYTPAYPTFAIFIKVGLRGYILHEHVFVIKDSPKALIFSVQSSSPFITKTFPYRRNKNDVIFAVKMEISSEKNRYFLYFW